MTWAWIIGAIIVLMALSAVWHIFTRFLFAFSAALTVLLLLHFRTNPGEASVALAGLGGTVLLRRPLIRMIRAFI